MPATSLVEALRERADEAPDATALVYVSEKRGDVRITRADLVGRAIDCAGRFADRGLRPGDVTLLAVDHGIAQIVLFLGALHVGATPCLFPALAPKLDPSGFADRLANAVARLDPAAIVSDQHGFAPETRARSIDSVELMAGAPGSSIPSPSLDRRSLAFLQLSSGSTGRQKVVPITHGAVLDLARGRGRAFRVTDTDAAISWVPLYHDLGLVGGVLAPLVLGIPSVLMSPFEWLARPAMQLQAVHRHRATMCTMPSFALSYCARRIKDSDLEGVDLASWRLLIASAEPIPPHVFDLFAGRFARWGFRREALATSYGLAEHTLTVTLSDLDKPPRMEQVNRRLLQAERRAEPESASADAIQLMSTGKPLQGVEIEIRSPDGAALPERRVGEICLRSPYVFDGYLNDDSRTRETLREGWLATGDLGYLSDGELFVCGRLKDLIIVAGMNVSAEQVESVVARVKGVKAGRVTAFGMPDDRTASEMVVVVAERAEGEVVSDEALIASMRAAIKRELEVTPGCVELVPANFVVKTTSGKNARWATRERWIASRDRGQMGAGGES